MTIMLRISGFLLIFAAIAHTGLSIECYECNSDDGSHHCRDPFTQGTPVSSVDCAQVQNRGGIPSSNAGAHSETFGSLGGTPRASGQSETKAVCFKAVFESADNKGNGGQGHDSQLLFARGCGLLGKKEQCKHIEEIGKGDNLKLKSCKACEDNLCNSSPHSSLMSLYVIVPALMATLYRAA